MAKELNITNQIFENIKHIDLDGSEYWYARELLKVLGYAKWQNFYKVIKQAIIACEKKSDNNVLEQFPEVRKLSKRNNNATIMITDYKLLCYACYLITQNVDPRKEVIVTYILCNIK